MMPAISAATQLCAPAAPSLDWSAFYQELQNVGHVPDASCSVVTQNTATFRGMCLDLSVLAQTIRTSGFSPPLTTIYTDVLLVPNLIDWLLNGTGLVVFARRIEVTGTATVSLDYRTSADAQFLLFSGEMAGTLTVTAVSAAPTGQTQPTVRQFAVTPANVAPGVWVNARGGVPTLQPVSLRQGMAFQLPDDMLLYLNNAFIFGSLLYDQRPDLALSIFLWVKGWAAQSDQLQELFYRSTSLATLLSAQVNAAANGAAFVPYLTAGIYTNLAKAFADEAAKYESDYMTLSTQKVLTDTAIKLAKTLAANADSETNYVKSLLKQANDNYDNAVAAAAAAKLNFSDQNLAVQVIETFFKKIGIPAYEREEIIKAVFSLLTAIVTFGAEIALMAMGDEAAAPAAAEGAVKSVETVAKAAETGAEVAKTASTLADTMEKLKKLVEELQKVYELAKAVKEVSDTIDSAEGQVKMIQEMQDTTDGADLSAADGWAIYKIQADDILQGPVDKGIRYAADYKQAVNILVVYGQSLSAAQLAVIKAGQQSAAITFQLHYAQEKQANLQKLVNDLKAGEAPAVAMMQEFYRRYLDAKSLLFSALRSYQASYCYWALQPSDVQPRIVDPVTNLSSVIQDITRLAMDQKTALDRFYPAPQPVKNKNFEVTDPAVLQKLRTTGTATWAVPLGARLFAGLSRVRLSTVRVWLEGAVTRKAGDFISVKITTAGNYLDRYRGVNYQFVSKPLVRPFQYSAFAKGQTNNFAWEFDDGSVGVIQLDGSVDKEVAYAYFQPTPFAEWSISLTDNNPGLDYSKVTKITMSFEGTAVGAAMAAGSPVPNPGGGS